MTAYSSKAYLAPTAPASTPSSSPGPSGSLQPGTKVQVGKYVVQVDKFLSEGGFAHVYVASLVSPSSVEGFAATQNKFVLKRMAVPDKAGLVQVRKEVDVMKQLRPHKHIVYFIEASASSIPGTPGYEIFILMEFCQGGGIIDLLNSRLQNRLTESEILKIFSDTVDAVAHMHSQSPILMHRDLKVENILVAAPNLYKLCDFGSTTTPASRPPQSTADIQALEADLNMHTTLQYRAPEMIDVWSRRGVTEKADIWALGVFLYKLCYYTTPFEEQGPLAIINVQYTIPPFPAYSNSIKHLIGSMFQELAQSRPDIWQVHDQTCKLRGIQPYLKRPAGQPSASLSKPDYLGQQDQTTSPMGSSPQNALPRGLDVIFTATPSSSLTRPLESVTPMRRGRPTTKSKNSIEKPTEALEPTLVPKHGATSEPIKPSKAGELPVESDLFAREAAAGFGDAFVIVSPKPASGLARVLSAASKPHQQPASSTHRGNFTPSSGPRAKTANVPHSLPQKSLPFDDLVPSTKKKAEVLSMNTIRNSQIDSKLPLAFNQHASRPAKRDSFTGPSSTSFPNPEHLNQNAGFNVARLHSHSPKTGSQLYGDHAVNPLPPPQAASASKALPAKHSGFEAPPSATQGLSLSDWLKKDQAELVSRAVQTSPTLLSCLINDLVPNLPLKNTNGPVKSPHNPMATKPAPVNLLDDEEDIAASVRPGFGVESIPNNAYRSDFNPTDMPRSHNQFRPTAKAKYPTANEFGTSDASLPWRPVAKNDISTSSGLKDRRPSHETTSSDSDDGPEDVEGFVKFPSRVAPLAAPLAPKSISMHSRETTLPPFQSQHNSYDHEQGEAETFKSPVLASQSTAPPSVASFPSVASSDVTTEEDEEIKARRRAAIAKFAPPATSSSPNEGVARDPFSSRAQTRSPSPEARMSSMLTGSRVASTSRPPLRAPKPQSLKSAAAITNLVSRYESLSTSGTVSPGPSSPPFHVNSKSKKVVRSVKTSTTGNGQRTSFKPITRNHSSIKSPPSSTTQHFNHNDLTKKPHVPSQSLEPRLGGFKQSNRTINDIAESVPTDDENEEVYNGVNNLKSKWESGAVKRAEVKTRVPRTDYGQT